MVVAKRNNTVVTITFQALCMPESQTRYTIIPQNVKDENEWPLGKLNPVTCLINGSRGRCLLKTSFKKYSNEVLVIPIEVTSNARFQFFLNKKIITSSK